ncbi:MULTISPECIES: hypothetical protein [Bacillus]|uniref:hypothetical protein n=1 Tax=Bacillus TaxID=1386 RepID=UPI00300FAC9B
MKRGSCYGEQVDAFDLVVSNESDFHLTRNKVYVVKECVGGDLIQVENDLGELETYTTEYFDFYEGQTIDNF